MRKLGGVIIFAVLCLVCVNLHSSESEEGKIEEKKEEKKVIKYVGSKQCLMCHAELDNAPAAWQEAKHSKAYESLAGEKAKEFSDDPQKAPECLQCHVTGMGEPGGFELDMKESKRESREGVTCEVCHGPGQEYNMLMIEAKEKEEEGALDAEKAAEAGLVVKPTGETCLECHNDKSPTFEKFDFKEMLEKIKHGEKLKKEGEEEKPE
ncbi:MAG: cytochrome c family protein [bacterium]